MLPTVNLKDTAAFQKLTAHFQMIKDVQIRNLFIEDPHRFSTFSVQWGDVLFDYSKNRITGETLNLLLELAKEVKLDQAIDKMFAGDKINATEGRPVLHTALRQPKNAVITVDGVNIIPQVHEVLDQMKNFTQDVLSGS